ncbi:MAG: tetratricopeptide repeat protein [Pleurocapsa sp.]
MAKTLIVKPLGLVLQKADLISPEQVKIALEERNNLPDRRIGEIMVLKGWIHQQTADFFAEQWPKLLLKKQQPPIGQYLKAAGLIDEELITNILQEQRSNGIKFGALAVSKGIVSFKTLNFFLEQLELVKSQKQVRIALPHLKQFEELNQIESYILYNDICDPVALLNCYRQVWQRKELVATNSEVEKELIRSRLVVKQNNKLQVARAHYYTVFDDNWIEQQLARLQPYGKIRLKLFGLETKASLPYKVLTEVNSWTNNQPFLTQKLYQIIQQRESFIPRDSESEKIEELVQNYILDNWGTGAAAGHLCQLKSALLQYQECSPISLLKIYKKIWQQRAIFEPSDRQQAYLIDLGLVTENNGQLTVANRIYQTIFDRVWIDEQIAILSRKIVAPVTPIKSETPVTNHPKIKYLTRNFWKITTGIGILLLMQIIINLNAKLILEYLRVRQLDQANKLWQQEKYQQALTGYNSLLQTNHGNRDRLWLNRGYALGGLKQYSAMLESCAAATLIEPLSALAWNCQGEANYHLQKYQLATNNFDRAIAIDSQEATFWLNKSSALFKLKQHLAAYAANVRAIKLIEQQKPNRNYKTNNLDLAIAYKQQGEILLQQQQYDRALTAFEHSLAYDLNDLTVQQGKGIALYELGAYQEAERLFEEILQRKDLSQSQQASTRLHQGINFCYAQKTRAATQAFNKVLQLTDDNRLTAIARTGCGIQ